MKEKIIKISWGKTSDGKVINVNDAIRDKEENTFHTGMILNAIQNLSIINWLSF